MKIRGSLEMVELGQKLAKHLASPVAIELIGDVGVGKTTFTQGLAKGLGIDETISSPSFTLSKRYGLPSGGELVHYDFYRLDDAGIMRDEIAETLSDENNIVVVEWAGDIAELFNGRVLKIRIALTENGERDVALENLGKVLSPDFVNLVNDTKTELSKMS